MHLKIKVENKKTMQFTQKATVYLTCKTLVIIVI